MISCARAVAGTASRMRKSFVRSSHFRKNVSSQSRSSLSKHDRLLPAVSVVPIPLSNYRNTSCAMAAFKCDDSSSSIHFHSMAAVTVAALLASTASTSSETKCSADSGELSPAAVGQDDISSAKEVEDLPVYTAEQVAQNNGENGRPIWMTYGGIVYDVTDFIPNHPGGSEKILMASGSAIEPFWHIYPQHFSTDLPMKLMEHMIVGQLAEGDQAAVDAQMEEIYLTTADPFERDPMRHKSLKVHSDTPMNAELPSHLLTENYLTPPALFYIRHHHPVPYLTDRDVSNYRLQVDLSEYGKGTLELSLDDLKKMEKVEVVATLQCSGNRRSGFNQVQRTSGTSWGQGAVSTAKWGGVRLSDVLKLAGLENAIEAQEKDGMEHVRFESLDGMTASICIEKAMNPYGDCLLAYEMNGEPLPRDHGYPLRVIVPGYAAVRNVKWVSKIELAKTEAEGPWQRGLNYKILPPSVTDAKKVNLDRMPSMTEVSVFSGITKVDRLLESSSGEVVLKVGGWAWAGGGRNVVRVDVTPDGGKTWIPATITEGSEQRFGRAWAWVFWEAEVPASLREDNTVELASKAVDISFNVQPEKCDHMWNVRGLGNNSWFRTHVRVS